MIIAFKKYILKIPKQKFIIFILLSVLSITIGIIMPYLNGMFLDYLVNRKDIELIYRLALIIAGISIGAVALNYVLSILKIRIQTDIAFDYNHDMIQHMQKVPLLKLEQFNCVYLNQRINSDVNEIVSFIMNNGIMFLLKWIAILVQLFLIYIMNKSIFVIAIIFLPIYCVMYVLYKQPIFNKSYKMKEYKNKLFQSLNDQLELVRSIKIDGTFFENKKRMRTNYNLFFNLFLSYSKFMTFISSLDNIVSVAFSSILLVFGAREILKGNLTIGQFTIINSYFAIVVSGMKYYLNIGKSYQGAKVAFIRIEELNQIEEEHNGQEMISEINKVDLENISFNYSENGKNVIRNFSKTFLKGKIYVIKGGNGTGKTTILNVLLGIINQNVIGKIKYNSKNMSSLDLYEIRLKHVSVVQQGIKFSNMKIRELLGEFRDFNTNEELEKYIYGLNLEELFCNEKFSVINYLDKRVSELSGGELQKIAILRALLKDGEILILDEPTSSFDKESVKYFIDGIKKISKDKIIIIITHNTNVEKIADEIIRFKNE